MKERNQQTIQKAIEQLPKYEPLYSVWSKIEAALNRKKTLKNAIEQLPQYTPLDSIWNKIEATLVEETTEKKLKKSIEQLPQYIPFSMVWDKIELELGKEKKQQALRKAIEELPSYAPPYSVWKNIVKDLKKAQKPSTKIIFFNQWKRFAAAAAIGWLIVSMGWLVLNYSSSPDLIYSQEIRNDQLLQIDWEEDEAAFASILAICKQRAFVCEQTEFKTLKTELQELNEAKDEVMIAMKTYGKDAQLVRQLTQIEHQRSDVLKKMVRLI